MERRQRIGDQASGLGGYSVDKAVAGAGPPGKSMHKCNLLPFKMGHCPHRIEYKPAFYHSQVNPHLFGLSRETERWSKNLI